MVQINFKEYARIWKEYNVTMNITKEESEQLKKGEIELDDLVSKYDCEYGESNDITDSEDSEVEYELIDMEEL